MKVIDEFIIVFPFMFPEAIFLQLNKISLLLFFYHLIIELPRQRRLRFSNIYDRSKKAYEVLTKFDLTVKLTMLNKVILGVPIVVNYAYEGYLFDIREIGYLTNE